MFTDLAAAHAERNERPGFRIGRFGPATRLEVEVKEPAVRHTVTMQQLQRWVESTAVTPADRIQREKLKALLRAR